MKRKQSNNFIFDITNSKMELESLLFQIEKIYISKTTNWVDKVIVKKNEDVILIYKKPAATLRVTTSSVINYNYIILYFYLFVKSFYYKFFRYNNLSYI